MRKGAGGVRLSFIKPMEPELVDGPPEGDDWSHEIKFDGYRTQVIKDEDGIRLFFTVSFGVAEMAAADDRNIQTVFDGNLVCRK